VSDVERIVARGSEALGVELPPAAPGRLGAYLELLARWARAFNLTAVREPGRMAVVHVLDSLAVAPHLSETRLLDMGTGAGLPGLVLAVALPDTRWTLLDANGKKVRFCRQAVAELGLGNVEVVQSRVEDYRPAAPFPAVISRAVGTLGAQWAAARHLLAPAGRLLLMKGARPEDEVAQVAALARCVKVTALIVPGLDAARHLVAVDAECARAADPPR
jgi:16S rRNA (guanine527-N7)-methyltransferase